MKLSLTPIANAIGKTFSLTRTGLQYLASARGLIVTIAVAGAGTYLFITHPPMENVAPGDLAVRTNQLTGTTAPVGLAGLENRIALVRGVMAALTRSMSMAKSG